MLFSHNPECHEPTQPEAWFPISGSEFVPWSTHIPNGNVEPIGICSRGLAPGGSDLAMLTFDRVARPVVGWVHSDVAVKKFGGTGWLDLPNVTIADPDGILVDSQNRVLAYGHSSSQPDTIPENSTIYLKRFDGASWVGVDGGASGSVMDIANRTAIPNVAINANGDPVVAWTRPVGGDWAIFALQWDGSQWSELAGSGSGAGISGPTGTRSNPTIATCADGSLVVAWTQIVSQGANSVACTYLRAYSGGAWIEVGGSATGNGVSGDCGDGDWSPKVMCGSDNVPLAASPKGIPGTSAGPVRVRRFNGSGWDQIGGALAKTPTGSAIDVYTEAVDFALDRDNNPVVTWVATTGDIYLRRWDGTKWAEVNGSASGGGITNSDAGSWGPALAISNEMICVLWAGQDPSFCANDGCDTDFVPTSRILMRCSHY